MVKTCNSPSPLNPVSDQISQDQAHSCPSSLDLLYQSSHNALASLTLVSYSFNYSMHHFVLDESEQTLPYPQILKGSLCETLNKVPISQLQHKFTFVTSLQAP